MYKSLKQVVKTAKNNTRLRASFLVMHAMLVAFKQGTADSNNDVKFCLHQHA
jgi:hypothetical protein